MGAKAAGRVAGLLVPPQLLPRESLQLRAEAVAAAGAGAGAGSDGGGGSDRAQPRRGAHVWSKQSRQKDFWCASTRWRSKCLRDVAWAEGEGAGKAPEPGEFGRSRRPAAAPGTPQSRTPDASRCTAAGSGCGQAPPGRGSTRRQPRPASCRRRRGPTWETRRTRAPGPESRSRTPGSACTGSISGLGRAVRRRPRRKPRPRRWGRTVHELPHSDRAHGAADPVVARADGK